MKTKAYKRMTLAEMQRLYPEFYQGYMYGVGGMATEIRERRN
jgi:hypothetical protein